MTSGVVGSNPYTVSEAASHGRSFLRLGRFGRNIFSNAGGSAIHSVVQLGLLFVLIRILDDARYAAFLLATFVVGLLEMASDFGTRIWATRRFSFVNSARFVLRRSVICKLIFTVVSSAIFALVPSNSLDHVSFLLCVLIASTQPSTDPFLWLLRGRERLDIEAGVVLACRISVAAGMLVAAISGFGLHALLLIWLVGNVVRIVAESQLDVVRSSLNADDQSAAVTDERLVQTMGYVIPIGAAFVLTCLFQRATVFLLDVFSTPQDVKYYGTAFKLVSTSGFVATSIFVSSFAALSRAIEADDSHEIRRVVRRKFMLVTAVFLPICVAGILLAPRLLPAFELAALKPISETMVLLMPGLYLSCVNMGLKYTLNAFELNWQDFTAVVVGLAVLSAVTVGRGTLTWPQAAAFGWCAGEATLLLIRVVVLRTSGGLRGVPIGVISAATATLVVMMCFGLTTV